MGDEEIKNMGGGEKVEREGKRNDLPQRFESLGVVDNLKIFFSFVGEN